MGRTQTTGKGVVAVVHMASATPDSPAGTVSASAEGNRGEHLTDTLVVVLE